LGVIKDVVSIYYYLVLMILGGFVMKKKDVSYEIIIDLISNIVKKYLDNNGQTAKEDEGKCLNVG
jgi:hypothetical protein